MSNDLYRAFWRWHFYAGLIALPFLAWLAVTGGLYLFKPEIERLVYKDWITLSSTREALPASRLVAETERQTGGEVTQVEVPASAAESWRMRVQVGHQARTAFVDPGSGQVLGTTKVGGIMKTVRDLHSLVITGTIGNALIETAAGWAVVLVVTGVVLRWPRGAHKALALRGPPERRRFWRDLHASTGVLAGGIVLFLAVTGMPWSVFWGAQVQRLVAENGLGRPQAPGPQPWEIGKAGEASHDHGASGAGREALPWAMQGTRPPHASGSTDVGVDRAIKIARSAKLTAPMTISLPTAPGQPYSFTRTVTRSEDARAIYVEPSTGRILQDASYAQFGKGAQLIEWGIATHQGQQYGPANRWIMLAGCIGLLLLCVSAPVLWWKRRLQGRLTAPPLPRDPRRGRIAAFAATALGMLYPLTGATMVVVLLVDRVLARRQPA